MGRHIVNPDRFTVRFTATGALAADILRHMRQHRLSARQLALQAVSKYIYEEKHGDHTEPRKEGSV